jgi:hypothetical protein
MGEVLPLPSRGEVFLDPRGEGRSLRVSWHRDANTLVLSLWQLGQCRATFRVPTEDVPDLVRALVSGLSDGLLEQRTGQRQPAPAPTATGAAPAPAPAEQRATPPGWQRQPVVQPEPAQAAAEGAPTVPEADEAPTVEKPAAAPRKPERADKPAAEEPPVTPIFLAPPDPA